MINADEERDMRRGFLKAVAEFGDLRRADEIPFEQDNTAELVSFDERKETLRRSGAIKTGDQELPDFLLECHRLSLA